MYFLSETHSFFFLPLCATLEDINNFLMLCTGFTQTFSRKCRNYRLRVIQTLISRRSAGSDGSVGLKTRLASERSPVRVWPRAYFSRFPRPNLVARRVFQFHDGVGVEFHAPFCWECLKAHVHFSAVRKMRLYLRLTSVCTPSLFDRFQTFLVWHDLDMSS